MRRWPIAFALLGACSSFDEGSGTTPDGGAFDGGATDAPVTVTDAGGDAPANLCTGALVCRDFEDASLPAVTPPATNVEHGVDETTAVSPTHSFWLKTSPVDAGTARAWAPTPVDVPSGSFELSFGLRVDSYAKGENPQIEVARINLTNDYQLEVLYDAGAGGNIKVLERGGCKALSYDEDAKPIVPFGLGQWANVKVVVRSVPSAVHASGKTITHMADAFIDGAQFLKDFALCEPNVRTPGALRYGLETNNSNPPFGWSLRFDDVVFFAR